MPYRPLMDPITVIIILALHLTCSGVLFTMIGRRMGPRSGLYYWGAGGILFGVAYFGRLMGQMMETHWWLLALDSVMVSAALLLVGGLSQFEGKDVSLRRYVAALLLFIAIQVPATLAFGVSGRYFVLILTLALAYARIALVAAQALQQRSRPLHPPLIVLATLMGIQAGLALGRAAQIIFIGTDSLFSGLLAQVFFAYASFTAVILALTLLWMVFERLNLQLTELATHDPLTRVLNRNGLEKAMERHFATRKRGPLSLLMVDLDHFKRVNDVHGHSVGDDLLKAVAGTLVRHLRGNDFVARVGGEEFLIGCVGEPLACTDSHYATAAASLGERLCQAIRGMNVSAGRDTLLRCTASIGVSRPAFTLEESHRARVEADLAVYAAKAAGRDQVITS